MSWLLCVLCVSAVAGAPFLPARDTAAPSSGNSSAAVLQEANSTGNPVLPSNDTQNWTVPAAGRCPSAVCAAAAAAPPSDPARNGSAETLEELQTLLPVLEGDILMPEDRNAVQTLWEDAVVFYAISAELADRKDDVDAAIRMISDATCIRFRRHGGELNYIHIRSGKGCASFVGCRGGRQAVFFGPSCSAGNLCHELIHALGLYHEHTRPDRDRHVTVHWDHIQDGKRGNFQVKQGDTLELPYDLSSIMHYGQYFFSTDGNPTIEARQSGEAMGQRSHLSQLDVQKLNKLYRCEERLRADPLQ